MGKSLVSNAKSYAKRIFEHIRNVVTRQESAGEAWAGVTKDTRKLKKRLAEATKSGRSKGRGTSRRERAKVL